MNKPVPEFSPAMLRLVLEGRAVLARDDTGQTQRQFIHGVARLAKVHVRCVHDAFAGRLKNAERRARLWAVFGHHPSDFGILLTDDGGQRHA